MRCVGSHHADGNIGSAHLELNQQSRLHVDDEISLHELFNSYPPAAGEEGEGSESELDDESEKVTTDEYWLRRYVPNEEDEGWHRWAYFRLNSLSQEMFESCSKEYQACT